MKMLDLCSGIAGISMAADWAGIETAAFCEIEEFNQKVLRKNYPRRIRNGKYDNKEAYSGSY